MSKQRIWTINELREAVSRMIEAAYGRLAGMRSHGGRAALSIPAQPDDADVLLYDAICELEQYRAKQHAAESAKEVLARLARYYHERRASAADLMNKTADLEVAARHAHSALDWQARYETILMVAKNLEIALPATPADHSQVANQCNEEANVLQKPAQQAYRWRVEALRNGCCHATTEYDGDGVLDEAIRQRLGDLCLSPAVEKIFIWRDGEKCRHIELQ